MGGTTLRGMTMTLHSSLANARDCSLRKARWSELLDLIVKTNMNNKEVWEWYLWRQCRKTGQLWLPSNGWVSTCDLCGIKSKELGWQRLKLDKASWCWTRFFCSNSLNLNLVSGIQKSKHKIGWKVFTAAAPHVTAEGCIARSWEGVNLRGKVGLIYILKVVKTGLFCYKMSIFWRGLKQISMRDENPN